MAHGDEQQWWYNHKTGEVEQGKQSLGSERDGPYATEAEARPRVGRGGGRARALARVVPDLARMGA